MDKFSLTKEDLGIFIDFTKSLGEMDIEGHNDMLALTLENLERPLRSRT